MQGLDQYLVPYIISQVLSLVILFAAWKNTHLARIFFVILFFYAGCFNLYIGFVKPDEYLEFAHLAVPVYRDFINGWFSNNNHIMIPLIAAGQLLISVGMLLNGKWVKWACISAIIFFFSIAPLMVGSAFPFSITMSIAASLIWKNDKLDFLWKRIKRNLAERKV